MEIEETHVYTVAPRRPIRGLVKGKVIIKPTDLSLTKEEVLECMKHGPVYRKFYLDGSERVTPSNLDRLHRTEHLTEEQYKALCEKLSDDKEDTEAVEETVEVEVSEEIAEDATEVAEDATEEIKKADEEQSSTENESESSAEDTVESVEETPVEEAPKPKKKKKKSSSKKKVETTEEAESVPETTAEE